MIKKAAINQLMLGMYVHKLSGSWLDHPFWKKSFLLDDAKQLELIGRSSIRDIWIDTTRGLDLPTEPDNDAEFGDDEEEPAQEPVEFDPAVTAFEDFGSAPCSLMEELERAQKIIAHGGVAMEAMFEDARLGNAIDAENCLPLVNDITQSVSRNPAAIVSLARLKSSDDYTYLHSVAVCALMVMLARQIGLPEAEVREAGLGGLIHDLGKVMIPVDILQKPGALTDEEMEVVRSHPEAGHNILVEAGGVSEAAMDVCLHHHEKINGRGYPHGLAGSEISFLARMGAVCDVYDAITSNRAYRQGWDPSQSVQKMAQWGREGHFDESILQAFIKGIGIYPIGSLVRLDSGKLAVVVDQSPTSLLTPIVKTMFVIATKKACEPQRIDLSATGCKERIIARESPEQWGLTDLDQLWMLAT
jgi:HD-GYP domain-containing protein (c-di-GMP phosphodiesterase class II)